VYPSLTSNYCGFPGKLRPPRWYVVRYLTDGGLVLNWMLPRTRVAAALAAVALGALALGAASASAKSRNLVLRANGQLLHGLRGGEPESGSPISASVSNFELSPGTASCSSGTMEGEVEHQQSKTYTASMYESLFSPASCNGVVLSVEFVHILLKSNGSAQISGEVEVEQSYGTCFFALKKIRGSFPVNEGMAEAPLVLMVTNQSTKLVHGSPAPCERTPRLSGTFSFLSKGYPVIAVLK
jgi:hypothetical protein